MTQSVNYCETCRWWKDRRPVQGPMFEGRCCIDSTKGRSDVFGCDHDFGCVLHEEEEESA